MFVLASANTYCVDCMQKRSSEVIAIVRISRSSKTGEEGWEGDGKRLVLPASSSTTKLTFPLSNIFIPCRITSSDTLSQQEPFVPFPFISVSRTRRTQRTTHLFFSSLLQSAGILPLVKAIGVGPANTIAAGLGLIGVVLVLAIIRWGEGWAGRGPPETPPTTPPPAAIGEEPSKLEEKAMEDANGFEPIDEAAREAIEVDFRERGDHALSRGKSSRRTSEPPLPLLKTFSIEHPHPV